MKTLGALTDEEREHQKCHYKVHEVLCQEDPTWVVEWAKPGSGPFTLQAASLACTRHLLKALEEGDPDFSTARVATPADIAESRMALGKEGKED